MPSNTVLETMPPISKTTMFFLKKNHPQNVLAQSAGAVEYTDCTSNECPRYDTKQSDGEVPAVLELWGLWSTPSLPSLPGPLWPGVVAPDRARSIG